MIIQKFRVDKGWSQEELAAHSGLSVQTIQRIENGKRASLESLKCLAAVFETQVSDLMQENPMNDTQTSNQYFLDQAEQEAIDYVQNLKAFYLNWITFIICLAIYVLAEYQIDSRILVGFDSRRGLDPGQRPPCRPDIRAVFCI